MRNEEHRTYKVRYSITDGSEVIVKRIFGEKEKSKGYTVKFYKNGDREWYFNGKLHRKNKPAIEYVNGTTGWFDNGRLHRRGGPAVEYFTVDEPWFLKEANNRQ